MRRQAQGSGTIRKRADGRWEARYTVGRDPGTGKQVQRSVYGSTQAEVRKKLAQITVDIDQNAYIRPQHVTVSTWMKNWQENYLGNLKYNTIKTYKSAIDNHIIPSLGATKITDLTTDHIQRMLNRTKLSPSSVKWIYAILHHALQQAVSNKIISYNPADACVLPRKPKRDMVVLSADNVGKYLSALENDNMQYPITVTLFAGLRLGEVLGLTWNDVDYNASSIHVRQQLMRIDGTYTLAPLKNDTERCVKVAPFVMDILKRQHKKQLEEKLAAGSLWKGNPLNLVFTSELGEHLCSKTLQRHHAEAAKAIGMPDLRFHDLRHSFATLSLQNGDTIKTVQAHLGHATAAFTLGTYAHFTQDAEETSASLMQQFIEKTLGTK